MAFVFAALRTGSSFLAATGVDRKMTDVVQALLVLALLSSHGDRVRAAGVVAAERRVAATGAPRLSGDVA